LVLKDINIDIKPREKIGIVGRTGAGKSSLTLALFRIIEPASGNISVDSLNTSAIGLRDLRQRLAIIPQDASLFEGTVRDNLDPSHVHDDTELWTVIELSNLKDKISSMDGKLDAQVQEGGSNLSVGERALVNLARALLTPSNILVMDEATGSIDASAPVTGGLSILLPLVFPHILAFYLRHSRLTESDRSRRTTCYNEP